MTTTPKPTYEELANAFAEYLAMTNNGGDLPFGLSHIKCAWDLGDATILGWQEAIERAQAFVDAAGGSY